MTSKIHIWKEDLVEAEDKIVTGITLEQPGYKPRSLWYRLPADYRAALTERCDPFVLGTLFTAMREATDLVVHGEVSPSLLRNLEEFQSAWACWRPERYTKIEVVADIERESPKNNNGNSAIAAFSGGVDSSYTVFCHRTGRYGRLTRNLQAGLMVHGFDIPLTQNDVFARAAERSANMLASLGLTLIPMATNFRELGDDWEDAFAAGLASCFMVLQKGYTVGLIPSAEPYDSFIIPWGSNPVTDWMMSNDSFQIIHDGAAFTRNEKVREIINWPEALKYLRVCWQGEYKDRNCGQCEKCIRTILNFRVAGQSLPDCFEQNISDRQIMRLNGLNSVQITEFELILSAAKVASISESWVGALEKCLYENRRAASGKLTLRQRIRKVVPFTVRRQLLQLMGRPVISQ